MASVNFKPLPGLVPRPPHQQAYSAMELANDLACRFASQPGAPQDHGTWLAIRHLSESASPSALSPCAPGGAGSTGGEGPDTGFFYQPVQVLGDAAVSGPLVIWHFPNAPAHAWVVSRTPMTWLVIDVVARASVLLPATDATALEDALEKLAEPLGAWRTFVATREAPPPPLVPPAAAPKAELPPHQQPVEPPAAIVCEPAPLLAPEGAAEALKDAPAVAPAAEAKPVKSAKKRPKKATLATESTVPDSANKPE